MPEYKAVRQVGVKKKKMKRAVFGENSTLLTYKQGE
jgi:hypothetical protein